ncbi:MAG: hypothetical protein HZA52_00215 [Planctomycetes bacterium]|nr:hypothetical protein [Planctomycetota bacterium]
MKRWTSVVLWWALAAPVAGAGWPGPQGLAPGAHGLGVPAAGVHVLGAHALGLQAFGVQAFGVPAVGARVLVASAAGARAVRAAGSGALGRQDTGEAEKKLNSTDPKERQEAIRDLAELAGDAWAIVLKKGLRDPEARVADEAQLRLGELTNTKSVPLLFGKDGLASGDEWVRVRVAEALGRMDVPLEAKTLVGQLDERAPAVRRTLVWTLERRERAGRLSDAERGAFAAALQKLAEKDKDPDVRAAATVAGFRMLTTMQGAPGESVRGALLEQALAGKAWQVRAAGGLCALDLGRDVQLATLEKFATDEHPGPRALAVGAVAALEPNADGTIAAAKLLVDRLEFDTNQRIRLDAYDALVRLSGFKYPLSPKPWRDWLRDPRPYGEKATNTPMGEYVGVTMTTFAGMRVRSQRVAFLIDLSGSMWEPKADGKTRKAAVDVEFERALSQLTPETQFNLIPYTQDPIPWQKKLVPATPQNVKAALEFFKGCTQRGKGNFWDAWQLALSDPAVDSVVVLTDGAPTGGRRWNLELMRPLLAEQNRFRRVALDAILVDAKGHLTELWKAMCADNRGTVHSSEL